MEHRCRKDKCKKPCKKECKKECKKHKKCSSSSSSDGCNICAPKVVYEACVNGGIARLTLTAVVETPNLDNPPTFTCPGAIHKVIIIRYTITNTGTVAIKTPRYIYDSLTGVHKAGKCKLLVGQTDNVTVRHCISKCNCKTGNINIVANAYINFTQKCLVLVSQPIAITIAQTL
jgi:hypothetical protein